MIQVQNSLVACIMNLYKEISSIKACEKNSSDASGRKNLNIDEIFYVSGKGYRLSFHLIYLFFKYFHSPKEGYYIVLKVHLLYLIK